MNTPSASQLLSRPLVNCQPSCSGASISLDFDPSTATPPEEPGVYVIYHLKSGQPFYVGEARNLFRRITYAFRCHRNDNPHPCHGRHKQVHGLMPDVADFCDTYGVRWLSTAGKIGRIEIEEGLKDAFGTNSKKFYENFDPTARPACEAGSDDDNSSTESKQIAGCTTCPVWDELSTNPDYRVPAGVMIPTMGGRAKPLFFRFDATSDSVQVWRANGNPNFSFGRDERAALCQRYQLGLKTGKLPLIHKLGGTSYFGCPKWPKPVLGMIKSPFAAAVIRHALRALSSSLSVSPGTAKPKFCI